ncbi:unnamed protein product [Camellia sinensis]
MKSNKISEGENRENGKQRRKEALQERKRAHHPWKLGEIEGN